MHAWTIPGALAGPTLHLHEGFKTVKVAKTEHPAGKVPSPPLFLAPGLFFHVAWDRQLELEAGFVPLPCRVRPCRPWEPSVRLLLGGPEGEKPAVPDAMCGVVSACNLLCQCSL